MNENLPAVMVSLTLFSACVWPSPVDAASPCGPRGVISDRLASKYNEHSMALGLQKNGMALEIYRTDDGATWTAVATSPEGTSCLVMSGTDWQDAKVLVGSPIDWIQ